MRSRTPLVSVLLPAFNAAETLRRSLASVRRQQGVSWECVVVNDGSTDATGTIVQAIAERDSRFRVVDRAHGGIVAALMTGLEACRGSLIARMDADDVMVPGRLALQRAKLLEDPTLVAVGSHVRLFPRAHLRDGRLAYERWLNALWSPDDVLADAFVECPIAHPTLMIRAQVLLELGYRDVGWPEDYDLVLRLLSGGHRVGIVPRVLLRWRDTSARLSRSDATYSLPRFVACKAAFLAADFLAARTEYVLWGYGDTGQKLCRALAHHGKHPRYIVELHPGRMGQVIAGARVIPPEDLSRTDRLPIVVSVAGATARGQIRTALTGMGYRDVLDYRVAA